MASIVLEHVTFQYPVFETTGRSLKVSMAKQLAGRGASGVKYVQALTDISFSLKAGDRVGLLGRNGSGKSSLLRILAGLVRPQLGRIDIQGKVLPLLDKGLGINPDLTGRQNIELPLRLLGATTRDVKHAMETIPAWTGLGPFMDLPFRTYSEGMKARLVFAVCTTISRDILVLDEWIAAGDHEFMEKAQNRIKDMVQTAKIVVLASHSMDIIANACNVAIWIDAGRMIMQGDPHTVIRNYIYSLNRPRPSVQELTQVAS